MAEHHFAGQTTAGAPDAIVDWFALFQNWITGTVGWTVVAGGGTTDLYLRSLGEAGAYTMLYVHVWRVGVGNTVRMEVADGPPVPLHETTEAGTVDSAGMNPFEFWMSANLEAIIIAWKNGVGCRFLYAGCLMPFALAPVDETYYMSATSGLQTCSVLRDSTGAWNVDKANRQESSDDCVVDTTTGTLPLFGLVADRWATIAGQYWMISSEIRAGTVSQGDTIETSDAGGTSTWIVLKDNVSGNLFALWTGGVIPTGDPDGTFANAAGFAGDPAGLMNAMAALLTGVGWTDHGDPGIWLPAIGYSRLLHSTGEDGTSDIWILLAWHIATNSFRLMVGDDAVLTNRADRSHSYNLAWFPTQYIMSGDKDCVCIALRNGGSGFYECLWLGKVLPAAPGCPSTYYNVCVGYLRTAAQGGAILRRHDGMWDQPLSFEHRANYRLNSNPSAYDGTTYFAWPNWFLEGVGRCMVGSPKYCLFTSGNIAQGDTITIGAKVYTCYQYHATPYFWLLRTA